MTKRILFTVALSVTILAMFFPTQLIRANDIVEEGLPNVPSATIDPKAPKGTETEWGKILKRMDFKVWLLGEGHTYDNLDLKEIDETTKQDLENTDDHGTFVYSQIFLGLGYWVFGDKESASGIYFDSLASRAGLWGNDQLGGKSSNNDTASTPVGADNLNLWTLNFKLRFAKYYNLTVGRQRFDIGGAINDYYLDDTLDAIVLQATPSPQIGQFKILAFDLFGSGSKPNDIYFGRFLSSDSETVEEFNGDTNTYRYGFVYSNSLTSYSEAAPGLSWYAFGFFMRYGALDGGGADRSRNGQLGNFADNDWTSMGGVRLTLDQRLSKMLKLKIAADAAYSMGKDHQVQELPTIDINGIGATVAAETEVILSPSLILKVGADGFFSQGGEYSSYGIHYNHGFVSFKGKTIGGLLLGRYAGFHPSAYTDDDGIDDGPNDKSRKSGTLMVHANVIGSYIFPNKKDKLTLALDYWFLKDTNTTNLNFDVALPPTPPNYTYDHLLAQERFGKAIGQEIDVTVNYTFREHLDIFAIGGIFLPGDYYAIEIEEVAGSMIGADGKDQLSNFWGINLGTRLRF